jgi:hypothetical protein
MIRSCYQFNLYEQIFKLATVGQQDKWAGSILILLQGLLNAQSC